MSNKTEKTPRMMPHGKRQYLVTYSQLDEKLFPTRQSFGDMIAKEFNRGDSIVKVLHWACSKEPHEEGGSHYHCSIKFNGVKRWAKVRDSIQSHYNIKVNFAQSEAHDSYISAYRYVVKSDKDFVLSQNHLDLSDVKSPRTKNAISANKRKSPGVRAVPGCKKKLNKLNNQEMAMFVRSKNIKTYTQLLALAEERRAEGLTDLSDYVFNHLERVIWELIDKSWKMASASTIILRQKKDRIDILNEYRKKGCVC